MNQELVKQAAAEGPELFEKLAAVLAEMEQTDPVGLKAAIQELVEVVNHADGKAKTAAAKDLAKEIGGAAAKGIAGTVLTGLGLALATDLYNVARRGLTSSRNWKRMIDANPHLQEKDLKAVRTAFHMVQRHAPDVAADPLAAGALVDNVVGVGDMPSAMHKQLETMVELQKRKADTRYEPFKGNIRMEFKSPFPKTTGGKE